MINGEITNKTSTKVDTRNKKSIDLNKRAELEKELNIQRNPKNKKKGPISSDMKMNQLNYYHEIAKNNIHFLMNNPTIKEIIRITSNESVFDQLKAKEESKDLSKFLDNLPLKRVERINYKGLEIGNMRKDLQNNNKAYINKEKGKKLAGNLFEKRKREGSVNFIPVLTVDNLFNYKTYYQPPKKKSVVNTKNKNNFMETNNESWLKKYKHKTHINNNKMNKSNVNESNQHNNAISIINNYKEKNNNLDSARIESNKYKKDFDIEKQKDKQPPGKIMINKEKSINTIYNNNNNIITNKYNQFNHRNNNDLPRRTLSQNFSDNKYIFRKDFQNRYNKENPNETSLNQDKLTRHTIFSSNNLPIHNPIPNQKGGSVIIVNNRRSNANTNNIHEIKEIKVLKKQDLTQKNNKYEPKVNINNNNLTRIKVTKVLNV